MFLFKRKNSPFYYIEYFDDAEQRKVRVSTKKNTKSEAMKFLVSFKDSQTSIWKPNHIKLQQFSEEYLNFIRANFSQKYFESVQSSFKVFNEHCGALQLVQVTFRFLEQFFTKRFNQTKHGAHADYRNLKSAFNKAIRWNYIENNPFRQVKIPKVEKNHPIFITDSQLQKISSCINGKTEIDIKDIVFMAFHTGARISEILNLRYSNVDLKNRVIRISNNETFITKSKSERLIPINQSLYERLFERLSKIITINNGDYLFQKLPGLRYNTQYISKRFKKAVKIAGVNDKIHFHSLRHSFASNLVQRGVNIYVIKELLGHQDIVTTQIYSHLQNENLIEAVKLLDTINPQKEVSV